jgi:hypothetical protein
LTTTGLTIWLTEGELLTEVQNVLANYHGKTEKTFLKHKLKTLSAVDTVNLSENTFRGEFLALLPKNFLCGLLGYTPS